MEPKSCPMLKTICRYMLNPPLRCKKIDYYRKMPPSCYLNLRNAGFNEEIRDLEKVCKRNLKQSKNPYNHQ